MNESELKTRIRSGPGGLDLDEGLRILKAYMAITSPEGRASALDYVERLAASQGGDVQGHFGAARTSDSSSE